MLLAMHAPYGSDQISDRLPSPSSLCRSATAKWTALLELVYSDARKLLSRLPRVFPSLPFRSILNYRLTNAPSLLASHGIFPFTYPISHAIETYAPDSFSSRAFIVYRTTFLTFPRAKKKQRKRKKRLSPWWIQLKSVSGFGP